MFEFAVLADSRRLAVALDPAALDAERGDRALRQQAAEFLADVHQVAEILDVAAGERIGDHGDRRRPPGRRIDRPSHFGQRLVDEDRDLADLRLHAPIP